MKTGILKFNGKAIYKPNGKAGEFSAWAANFYNGCGHACSYCYNSRGLTSGTLGGTNPLLTVSIITILAVGAYTVKQFVNKATTKVKKGGKS